MSNNKELLQQILQELKNINKKLDALTPSKKFVPSHGKEIDS